MLFLSLSFRRLVVVLAVQVAFSNASAVPNNTLHKVEGLTKKEIMAQSCSGLITRGGRLKRFAVYPHYPFGLIAKFKAMQSEKEYLKEELNELEDIILAGNRNKTSSGTTGNSNVNFTIKASVSRTLVKRGFASVARIYAKCRTAPRNCTVKAN